MSYLLRLARGKKEVSTQVYRIVKDLIKCSAGRNYISTGEQHSNSYILQFSAQSSTSGTFLLSNARHPAYLSSSKIKGQAEKRVS